jgi:hypothetical protein
MLDRFTLNALLAEGADLGASFGYTANWYPGVKPGWQDWKFFTKLHDGYATCCSSWSSLNIDAANMTDGEIIRAARAHFRAMRKAIAEKKLHRFHDTGIRTFNSPEPIYGKALPQFPL